MQVSSGFGGSEIPRKSWPCSCYFSWLPVAVVMEVGVESE